MVRITGVEGGSLAAKAGIFAGDVLLSVNGKAIEDVLDYRFYLCEKRLSLALCRDGQDYTVKIEKDEYDDIGLLFETYLMDEKRRCANGCIFCFIDQNPKGMRETIYFKDDDTRLSFLQGNYVTLTNLGEKDVRRIIDMKMSPVNISVHTTDPDLRVKMLRNKNAGKVLEYLRLLDDGGITMNFQIVLCRGINDGEALGRSMRDLAGYENTGSVAIVPAGLTKHREGLYPLTDFSREEALGVITQVEKFASECEKTRGEKLFFCSDEFYLKAGKPLPCGDYYDGYPQIENGVGMIASTGDEFDIAIRSCKKTPAASEISVATGEAAYDFISGLASRVMKKYPQINIHVYKVTNEFYGRSVTVAGLLTGGDILCQLKGKPLGDRLLLSECMVRSEGHVFLDGMSTSSLSDELGVSVSLCTSDGGELFSAMIGE